MTGFACGAKLTAVPILLLGIPAAMIVSWLIGRSNRSAGADPTQPDGSRRSAGSPRRLVIGLALFVLTALVVFSPWAIRNQLWTGNPLFPEAMEHLGPGHFSQVQVERWRRAHSPRLDQQPFVQRLKAGWNQVAIDGRYAYLLLPLGVVGLVLGFRRPQTWPLGILWLVLAITWLGFTHLQSRFFVLTIPIAALLIAQIPWGSLKPLGVAALLVMAVAGGPRPSPAPHAHR